MPDEIKEPEAPALDPLRDQILQIKLTRDSFTVMGEIIKNEPMALWMLSKAIDYVKAWHINEARPKIEKPGGIMNFARGIFK